MSKGHERFGASLYSKTDLNFSPSLSLIFAAVKSAKFRLQWHWRIVISTQSNVLVGNLKHPPRAPVTEFRSDSDASPILSLISTRHQNMQWLANFGFWGALILKQSDITPETHVGRHIPSQVRYRSVPQLRELGVRILRCEKRAGKYVEFLTPLSDPAPKVY